MKKGFRLLIVFLLCLFFPALHLYAADNAIRIKGSDTLVNMVQVLAEKYSNRNPDKKLSVVGGGSGTGIAALINNECDIANASRAMTVQEVEDANNKGINPKRIIIGIDGLCIIVNESNTVTKLTLDQISAIYRGEIKNWKELGGADLKITLYGRQTTSGTRAFLRDYVLKEEYSPEMKAMNGNAQIVESVKQDKSGIGYVGAGYARGTYGISVVLVASNPNTGYFSPLNLEDVRTGHYPITRPLNQYVNGDPAGDVKDFILYELSKEGQAIIEREGFFPVPAEYQKYNEDILGERTEFGG